MVQVGIKDLGHTHTAEYESGGGEHLMLELEPFYHTNQFQPTWLNVHLLLKTLA
jgi:hypothetical protein